MKLAALPGEPHLSYCTNIHAGESWAEVHEVVRTKVPAVKARVCPNAQFGVGLRLSARAADELETADNLATFQETLTSQGLYVFTINGFPYGSFHGTRVKENVYLPDWRTSERAKYTLSLARLLAGLLPDDVRGGSVSTLPLGFRAKDEGMASSLCSLARSLSVLRKESGKTITIALEPEPECMLETAEDAVKYFEEHIFRHARREERLIRTHLGVCLDACHEAVLFQEARESVARLERAGIAIAKIQLSCGLEARGRAPRAELERFAEDTYLHQCVVKRGSGAIERYLDLPDALRQDFDEDAMLRSHVHVPIFKESLGLLKGTQPFLRELLAVVRDRSVTEHLEVETYTWDVLPREHRMPSVIDDIARELEWVKAVLA